MGAVPQLDAAERVRRRLQEWAKTRGRGAGKELAAAVPGKFGQPMTEQWASGILNGRNDLRLADLDSIAELLHVPPGDLVRRDGDHYVEVIPSEMRFLKYVRSVPDTVRHHWLMCLDYLFAFQEQVMNENRATIDKRTKAARLQRERELAALRKPPRAG